MRPLPERFRPLILRTTTFLAIFVTAIITTPVEHRVSWALEHSTWDLLHIIFLPGAWLKIIFYTAVILSQFFG